MIRDEQPLYKLNINQINNKLIINSIFNRLKSNEIFINPFFLSQVSPAYARQGVSSEQFYCRLAAVL